MALKTGKKMAHKEKTHIKKAKKNTDGNKENRTKKKKKDKLAAGTAEWGLSEWSIYNFQSKNERRDRQGVGEENAASQGSSETSGAQGSQIIPQLGKSWEKFLCLFYTYVFAIIGQEHVTIKKTNDHIQAVHINI